MLAFQEDSSPLTLQHAPNATCAVTVSVRHPFWLAESSIEVCLIPLRLIDGVGFIGEMWIDIFIFTRRVFCGICGILTKGIMG